MSLFVFPQMVGVAPLVVLSVRQCDGRVSVKKSAVYHARNQRCAAGVVVQPGLLKAGASITPFNRLTWSKEVLPAKKSVSVPSCRITDSGEYLTSD